MTMLYLKKKKKELWPGKWQDCYWVNGNLNS